MTEILIYGIVGDSWDGLDAKTLVPRIADGDDALDVRINSPGGYVMEGLAIFNAVTRERAKGRTVTVHIDGLAASMASVIAMAGDEIIMADNALMMIHNPWDVAIGDAAELRRAANQLDTIRDQLVKVYSQRTGIDADTLIAMLDAETWLTAEQALDQNFITSISEVVTAAACDVSAFGFRKAPEDPHLVKSIGAVMASIRPGAKGIPSAIAAKLTPKETIMSEVKDKPAVDQPPALTTNDVATAAQAAVQAERDRVTGIRALAAQHSLDAKFTDELVASETTLAQAREKVLDKLAEQSQAQQVGHLSPARITQDERDKWRDGATAWLAVRAGVAPMIEKAARERGETVRLDPGEFRGASNVDLAREALGRAGIRTTSRDRYDIVSDAMTARSSITQTTSDFPVLFENLMHKTLQSAYAVTPDTWSRFCGIGSVSDFRAHGRYLRGSFGALDSYGETGEIKNKPIPDGSKETLKLDKKGNIVNLSREAIVNDDLDVFSGLAVDLGRAAKLTIEVNVYAVLNSNPTMADGFALFSAQHGNLAGAGAAPSVTAFDAIRVAMASQKDVSGNEVLDLKPAIILAPVGLGSAIRVINDSPFDPDATNKLQRPNPVGKMFSDVIDTARLTGTAYYAFLDPAVAPALEVAFLDGQQDPMVDSREGWRNDGVEWRVRHYFAVGAVNWRAAYRQPGA
ncbi:ClpP-like prohead protease/major capsid protein fusion protein [Sphingomonas sp. 1P06PA]|uniref:ClpP-like prohead protease/major capsid protein fusion protein n=1 Tax=Sphingomonas sp. 1P06PA TaxID=554121 RepID=UPI0039A65476